MQVKNISKALQGVHTARGVTWLRPGEARELELTAGGVKQARRLKGLLEVANSKDVEPVPSFRAIHHGGGKFNVVDGESVLVSGLGKADADAFNAMSDEDKKAYAEATKQG